MSRERRLVAALLLNVAVVAAQAVAGVVAHSVGLLADAGHNLTDVAALALSLFAVRLALRAPTASRSFGWHRSTILAAQVNAASLFAVTAVIAYESVRRLLHPAAPHGGVMVAVAAGTLLVNLLAARVLSEPSSADLNMRTAVLHMAGDAAASAAVVVAGLVIVVTGAGWVDPAASLAIGVLIAWEAAGLVRETSDVLLESTPADLDLETLSGVVMSVPGVEEVHDLHVWSLSSEVRALSAHVVLSGHPTLEEAQATGGLVKAAIAAPFGIAHATLELECETCAEDQAPCAIDEPAAGSDPLRDRPSAGAGRGYGGEAAG